MAEPIDIEAWTKALAEAMGLTAESLLEFNKTTIASVKANRTRVEDAQRLIKMAAIGMKAQKGFTDEVIKSTKSLKTGFGDTVTMMGDFNDEIETLNKEINATTDATKKEALVRQRSAVEEEKNTQFKRAVAQNFGNSVGEMTGKVIGGITRSAMTLTNDVLHGGVDFSTAGQMMGMGIDIANTAAQVGAKGLMGAGQAAAAAGGKLGVLGVIATSVGEAMSMVASGLSELAKAGIQFLIKETTKTISNFQTMNSAGAVFAGGMIEMRRTANEGGYTLDQFGKVVSANTGVIANTGLSMSALSKGISKVGRIFDQEGGKIRKSLLNLGYGFEEQADMTAKVMGIMNRNAPKGQQASAEQIATQTQKYAENLRMLSDLTGEDAKAKAAKIADENTELAFEQEMAGKTAEEKAAVADAMEHMTDLERKNFRERLVFGTVINKAGAVQEAMVDGQREKNEKTMELFRKGQLSGEKQIEVNSEYAPRIKESVLGNKGIARAGMATGNKEYTAGMSESLKSANAYEKDNVAKTLADHKQAKEGKGSEGMTDAQIALQKANLVLEQAASDHLKDFGAAVTKSTDLLVKGLDALRELTSGKKIPSIMDTIMAGIKAGGAELLLAVGMTAASFFKGRTTGTGPIVDRGSRVAETTRAANGGAGKVMGGIGEGISSVGKGLGGAFAGLGKGAGEMLSGVLTGLATGLKALGDPKALLGAVTMVALGGSMLIMSKAMKVFGELDWEGVAKGLTSILAVGALGALAGAASEFIIPGAAALALLGVSIGILGAALKGFPTGALDPFFEMFDGFGTEITDVFAGAWDSFKGFFSDIGDAVRGMFETITSPFKDAYKWVSEKTKALGETIGGMFDWVKSTASTVVSAIISPFKTAYDWVSGNISAVTDAVSGAWDWIKNATATVASAIAAPFTWAFGKISDAAVFVRDNIGSAFTWVQSILGNIGSSIAAFFTSPFTTISNAATWVKDNIGNAFTWITSAAATVGTMLVKPFNEAFAWIGNKIANLTTTFSDMFAWISSSASSVASTIAAPFTWAFGIVGDVAASASNIISGVFDWIKGAVTNVGTVIKEVGAGISSFFNNIKDTIGKFISTLTDAIPGFIKNMFSSDKKAEASSTAAVPTAGPATVAAINSAEFTAAGASMLKAANIFAFSSDKLSTSITSFATKLNAAATTPGNTVSLGVMNSKELAQRKEMGDAERASFNQRLMFGTEINKAMGIEKAQRDKVAFGNDNLAIENASLRRQDFPTPGDEMKEASENLQQALAKIAISPIKDQSTTTPEMVFESNQKHHTQLLAAVKELNENIANQTKVHETNAELTKRLLDVNQDQLHMQGKTFNAVS